MDFGEVIKILRASIKEGRPLRAYRKGWHGIGAKHQMWVYIEPGKVLKGLREPLKSWLNTDEVKVMDHFNLVVGYRDLELVPNEDGSVSQNVNWLFNLISGWNASQVDLTADDWCIIEE
jgi:hypothetical protein